MWRFARSGYVEWLPDDVTTIVNAWRWLLTSRGDISGASVTDTSGQPSEQGQADSSLTAVGRWPVAHNFKGLLNGVLSEGMIFVKMLVYLPQLCVGL